MTVINTPLTHKQPVFSRITWLDIAKGICMIMVIYGHSCLNFGLINHWICSFFMGLFFMSGGYTYRYRNNWLSRNFKSILIPYLLWAIIGLIFSIIGDIVKSDFVTSEQTTRILKTITGIAANNYPLWFLVAYFVSKSAYDIVNQCINSEVCKSWKISPILLEVVSVVIISAIGYLYTTIKPFGHSIMRFDTGLIMLPLFTAGRYTPLLFERITRFWTSLLAIVFFLCINILSGIIFNQLVSVNSNDYGNIFLFFTSTISGSLAIFLICKAISEIPYISSFLAYIGANSLIILCCHYFFLFFIAIASILLIPHLREYPLTNTILCLTLMLPAISWLRKLTNKVQNLKIP